MSTALIVQDKAISLPDIMTLGDVFTKSGYFRDVREQAQAVVKILYGGELGFSPVVSMMGVHVIEGKPALSANLMGALVKRSGKYDYLVMNLTDKVCLLEFTQNGKKAGDSVFTIEDAQRAGVCRPGSGWTKYPRNMLFARALSNGVKMFCPDLSACPIYVPEEMGAEVNEEGEVVELPKSAKPVETTKEPVRFQRKESKESAEDNKVQGVVATTRPAETPSTAGVVPPSNVTTEPQPVAPAVEYIPQGFQRGLHADWRKAVRKDFPADKDFAFYDFLLAEGFVDDEKVPTAGRIPMARWNEVRTKALAKARSL